jgi:hypothetical protein
MEYSFASSLTELGQFAPVEKILKDIASGEWKGKNLSRLVGSKEQKNRMKVAIMEAPISSTFSILWQIDIGFYDELPWVQQQIAKGKYLDSYITLRIHANSPSLASGELERRGSC